MIEVIDLQKKFGATNALDGVSMSASRGEVIGLLGPNGAGKTTLVRILATLLRPDAGRATIGGHDVVSDAPAVRSLIGLAGQAAAVDDVLTGRENLELIGQLYGLGRKERRQRAGEILERFGLAEAAARRPGTYSGGMRRRLDLAATLVGRPSVLLLDEPTAGLDPRSRQELWAFVDEVAADGCTVLLTTQYLEEVERLATRIVLLDKGRVVTQGTADDLKRRTAGDVLEARTGNAAQLALAQTVLRDLTGVDVHVDTEHRRVTVPITTSGPRVLVAAGRQLEAANIDLTDLGIRRPSLDEVFLALTGPNARSLDTDRPASANGAFRVEHQRAPDPAHAETPPRTRGRLLSDIAATTRRNLVRMLRTPQIIFFSAVQPILFVLGLEAVFAGLVEQFLGGQYIDFLLPGVVVMNGLLAAGMTGAAFADDVQAGIIDRFRSLPMARAAVPVARTLSDLVRTTSATAAMVAVGVLLGYRPGGGVVRGVAALAVALLFSYAFTWLFAAVGLVIKNAEAARFAGFAPVLPLVYLSGIWVPVEAMDASVRWFARNQPVNVAVAAVRSLATGGAPQQVGASLVWSVVMIAVFAALTVRRYQRS